ncbi:hypothetical protein GCM10009839_01750 [Catenulispora yoronensis]|uniref:PPM-type phosphatase domain-containing protein n=2 Tax=Catenulispora yoronensis TaxID=450799 RepID=A0ABN2TJI9_9ACTN
MTPPLLESEDVAWFRDEPASARGAAAALGRRIGLDEQRSSEVALAASEVATNLGKHAVDGAILLRVIRTEEHAGIEFLAIDHGPGMQDVAESLRDGVSSAGSLGIGLGAVIRLADAFDIHTLPTRGTVLWARFWPRTHNGVGPAVVLSEPTVAGVTRPITGEEVCGDSWATRLDSGAPVGAVAARQSSAVGVGAASAASGSGSSGSGSSGSGAAIPGAGGLAAPGLTASGPGTPAGLRRRSPQWAATAGRSQRVGDDPAVLIMLCDGLGHGPLAAVAADTAVRAFRNGVGRHPEDILQEIHQALRGTRGAAVAVARIEPSAGRLLYCGVGNIVGALVDTEGRWGLLSQPGIVGLQMHRLRTFEYQLPPHGALAMHSDGLSDRWSVQALPGLLHHAPIVIAGQLLREVGTRRDDAGIVVAKGLW